MLDQLLAKKTDFSDANASEGPCLKRTLGPWGLTVLGIGAVIGGGIFVITGQAAAEHAGPAIVLCFVIAAFCCSFTALCYAEFATLIPMSGSSYSYAYATLGELVAWFIGWNMVLEYGVSASAVAVSWTGSTPGRTMDALLNLNRAGTFDQFRAAVRLLSAPSQPPTQM